MTSVLTRLLAAATMTAALVPISLAQNNADEPASRAIDLPSFRGGSVSPDGRYYAYQAGALTLRDLSTGEVRPIVPGSLLGPWTGSLWSRGSERVLYLGVDGTRTGADVRSIRADGTGMRILAAKADYALLKDWSPDGLSVLLRLGVKDGPRAAVLSLADGTIRVGSPDDSFAAFSPDGRYVIRDQLDPGGKRSSRSCRPTRDGAARSTPSLTAASRRGSRGLATDGRSSWTATKPTRVPCPRAHPRSMPATASAATPSFSGHRPGLRTAVSLPIRATTMTRMSS